jgi:hypothetical protein
VAGLFKQTCVSAELLWEAGAEAGEAVGSFTRREVRGQGAYKMSKNDFRKKDRYSVEKGSLKVRWIS